MVTKIFHRSSGMVKKSLDTKSIWINTIQSWPPWKYVSQILDPSLPVSDGSNVIGYFIIIYSWKNVCSEIYHRQKFWFSILHFKLRHAASTHVDPRVSFIGRSWFIRGSGVAILASLKNPKLRRALPPRSETSLRRLYPRLGFVPSGTSPILVDPFSSMYLIACPYLIIELLGFLFFLENTTSDGV